MTSTSNLQRFVVESIALQVAKKIASCNRALKARSHWRRKCKRKRKRKDIRTSHASDAVDAVKDVAHARLFLFLTWLASVFASPPSTLGNLEEQRHAQGVRKEKEIFLFLGCASVSRYYHT